MRDITNHLEEIWEDIFATKEKIQDLREFTYKTHSNFTLGSRISNHYILLRKTHDDLTIRCWKGFFFGPVASMCIEYVKSKETPLIASYVARQGGFKDYYGYTSAQLFTQLSRQTNILKLENTDVQKAFLKNLTYARANLSENLGI